MEVLQVLAIIVGMFFVGWLCDKIAEYRKGHGSIMASQPSRFAEYEGALTDKIIPEYRQSRTARREEWRRKYQKYLQSSRWKRVRKKVLTDAGYRCAICGGYAKHVHHRRYPRGHGLGQFKRENYGYLKALCAKCHMKQHNLEARGPTDY